MEDTMLILILETIVSKMRVEGISDMTKPGESKINFEAGRPSQIIESLDQLDVSTTMKGLKYPLIAVQLPVKEKRGSGFYALVTIPRIVIATMSKTGENTEKVIDKYRQNGTFKKVLYPCYHEFLNRVAWSPYTNMQDPDSLVHVKMDNPGQQPIGQGSSDYVDTIEILNLEIIINQIKTC